MRTEGSCQLGSLWAAGEGRLAKGPGREGLACQVGIFRRVYLAREVSLGLGQAGGTLAIVTHLWCAGHQVGALHHSGPQAL